MSVANVDVFVAVIEPMILFSQVEVGACKYIACKTLAVTILERVIDPFPVSDPIVLFETSTFP